jgi:deazaflavin-dependent oxidoreductase (nitroreductase family)
MAADFQRMLVEEFRANKGRLSGMFEGQRLILVTTTGRRSGLRHTNPLGPVRVGQSLYIIGSAGGAQKHPAWFHNVRDNSRVTVEDGERTFEAEARVLEDEERDRVFAAAVAQAPAWADYQSRVDRILPVVELREI